MSTENQKREPKAQQEHLSEELENLAKNPLKESEAGEIEGGFTAASAQDAEALKFDINFFC